MGVPRVSLDLDEFAEQVHNLAYKKKFWEGATPMDAELFAAKIALVHSEFSEALEKWRNNDGALYFIEGSAKPHGWAVELLDGIIRALDMLKFFAPSLQPSSIGILKHEFNKTRPDLHDKLF